MQDPLATTPEPPYYAVIFTSLLRPDAPGYAEASDRMSELVQATPGYLGSDHAREEVGITVAYFTDETAIAAWREHPEHTVTRARGRAEWYSAYTVRVARVERAYGHRHSEVD
ncbi:antibiotic biosynthesis monooxygenase family protein [Actinokineospora guangxiensis]|uniref:Antibiotic biosynthesis monooxygenase family protein n=1 Tax=Actinokineospora guangxiensis TaxID=1490288 RepID=A0ABW0EPT0_9PSEU